MNQVDLKITGGEAIGLITTRHVPKMERLINEKILALKKGKFKIVKLAYVDSEFARAALSRLCENGCSTIFIDSGNVELSLDVWAAIFSQASKCDAKIIFLNPDKQTSFRIGVYATPRISVHVKSRGNLKSHEVSANMQ